MSDPRLSRLAQLWSRGVEGLLSSAEEAELRALMDDAPLAQAWVEEQHGREAAGAALEGGGRLPGSLRSLYRRNYRPFFYWGLRLALPLTAGLLFLAWPRDREPVLVEAVENDQPFEQVQVAPERPAHPKASTALGPPPGMGERSHLWVNHSGKSLGFEMHLGHAAHVKARVLNQGGAEVAALDLGQKAPGKVRVEWDGRLGGGDLAPAGPYRVKVYVDGSLAEEKELRVEKK